MSIVGLFLNESCLKEDSTISLHCETRGFPRPRIKFLRDETEIVPGTDFYTPENFDQASSTPLSYSTPATYTTSDIHYT